MAGLYIHIPFCTNKCFYCDFYSGNQLYLLDAYVEALIRELKLRKSYLGSEAIQTIYFGGGTPSLLSSSQLYNILQAVHSIFVVESNCEVTIECNPENINEDYVNYLYNSGINRISLGIQFLDDKVLKDYNRKHDKELIYNALDVINNSSFSNLSVDLIYAVPGISDHFLTWTLKQLLVFDIQHISAYSLTIAKNSQLYWKIKKGEFVETKETSFLSQYQIINEYLTTSGFIQYEISNYAKDGFFSRHNLGYWNQTRYLGIGVSAHSYNLSSRTWNHTNIKKYIRDLSGVSPNIDLTIEELSDNQIYNEYIILKLRLLDGISIDFVKNTFRKDIYDHFLKAITRLGERNYFNFSGDLVIPKPGDLLVADYLSQFLMI